MFEKRPRYPFPRYPTGWFQVGWSKDLQPATAVPVSAFGKALVLFRTEAGEPHLLDAHCPHLGAHLGYGGRVEGNELVCPFHAWRFDGNGACAGIPYATKIPKKSTLAKWHMVERNGLLLAWHDIDGRPPHWEVPIFSEVGSEGWSEPYTKHWKIRTANQEMAENAVDSAHFKYLHGTQNQPVSTVDIEGHILHMHTPTTMSSKAGNVEGSVEAFSYGFGFSQNRFTGFVETLLMGCVTPIDEDFVDVRFTFTVKRMGGADITKGIGKAFVAEITRQLEQDTPVWENKIYVDPPMLCDGDGPIGLFRKWCKQFYPEWYKKQAWEAFHGRPFRGISTDDAPQEEVEAA